MPDLFINRLRNCRVSFFPLGSEEKLLQSADLAMLLTNSTANGGIGGQVDGVDPIRNPGIFRCAWSAKNFKGAFVHEIGHLFGARDKFYYHITQTEIRNYYKNCIYTFSFVLNHSDSVMIVVFSPGMTGMQI